MKAMPIQQTLSPESADINFLTQKINAETPIYGTAYPLSSHCT